MIQVLDDPSGNSFIENPLAPDVDPFLSVDHYSRTSEQEVQLGIVNDSTDTKVRMLYKGCKVLPLIYLMIIILYPMCMHSNLFIHLSVCYHHV